MTIDFSNVTRLSISGKTARYEIVEWTEAPKPVLILKPGGSENRPYFNAMLREMGNADVRALKRGIMSADQLNRTRDAARRLIAEHCVAGWENLKDASGYEAPFSVENAKALFAKMPDYMVDGVRTFIDEPGNFLGEAPIDAEEVAGN